MPQISKRLNVEIDSDDDVEMVLDVEGQDVYHYLKRAEAERLLSWLLAALRGEDGSKP